MSLPKFAKDSSSRFPSSPSPRTKCDCSTKEIEGLEGREVADRDGEKLGHVVDLMIDQFHNENSFLELETDGFLGIGRKHLLSPLR